MEGDYSMMTRVYSIQLFHLSTEGCGDLGRSVKAEPRDTKIYRFIYIYIHGEREREREMFYKVSSNMFNHL